MKDFKDKQKQAKPRLTETTKDSEVERRLAELQAEVDCQATLPSSLRADVTALSVPSSLSSPASPVPGQKRKGWAKSSNTNDSPLPPTNLKAFWIIVAISLILPAIPILNWLMMPITTFVAFIHELGHATVCLLTGGHVTGLTIVSDGIGHGGLTNCLGGWTFFTNQAGYIGSAVVGCALILLGQFQRASKSILVALGVAFGLASLLLIGFNVFNTGLAGVMSFVLGMLLSGGLVYGGLKLKQSHANLLLLFLSIQTALNAVTYLFFLVSISVNPGSFGSFSDATNMEQMTHIPASIWSISWALISMVMLFFTLKVSYGNFLFKGKK